MLKKLFVSGLIVIVLIAAGASAYNVAITRAAEGQIEKIAIPKDTHISSQTGPGLGSTATSAKLTLPTRPASEELSISPKVETPLPADPKPYTRGSGSGQGNQYGKGQSQGQGRGQGQGQDQAAGQRGKNGPAGGSGVNQPDPQNGFQEWVTLQGVVSDYLPPNLTLLLDDGQTIQAQLGNTGFIESLGLNLQAGEYVTVVGFDDPEGGFAVGQITLQSSGETFILRNELGQPAWAGGANH
jgi:hypothetical protein